MALLEAWESEVSRREAVMEVLLHNISINDFYKKRKPSPTRRISLSITGGNE